MEGVCKPLSKEFEGKWEGKFGGYGLGPVKGWSELQVNLKYKHSEDKEKNKPTFDFEGSQSFTKDDISLGFKVAHDLNANDGEKTNAFAVLTYNQPDWMV